ncbi:MAG: LysM peptidoglycan-binding domain-containing protein [Deltaproteobacteria bacterium]|nr:LysM peptidoglycan-binding domain-containing protein [Deltaproteobacteria bacterium]
MEWKDRERQAEDEDATGRIDVEAPGYSVLREGAGGFSVAGILRRPLIPVAILAAVVLLVGVWRMGGEPSPTYGEQLARLESRIAQLEQRLETMAPSAPTEADTDAEGLQRQIDALMRRLDRTETALSQRVAALESKAYSIGRRENLSVEKLCQLNNLKAGDPIRPGDRLKVSP